MKKSNITNIILVVMLVAGLSLLIYPSFSNFWNSSRQTQMIASYAESVAKLDTTAYREIMDSAKEYNQDLLTRFNCYTLTDTQRARYYDELNFSGDGIMGYVEIPSIDVMLPIYHGTSEEVLQVAIGHLDWSSLPTGGKGTHCVISGHRGLPSARLFTDLDLLGIGDVFMMNVLGTTMTYQIDNISIVEPHETESLLIDPQQDYCTLVTCTPYGVNSHRILVRGTRIANAEKAKLKMVTADAIRIEPVIVAPVVAAPMLLVLLIMTILPKRKDKRRKKDD